VLQDLPFWIVEGRFKCDLECYILIGDCIFLNEGGIIELQQLWTEMCVMELSKPKPAAVNKGRHKFVGPLKYPSQRIGPLKYPSQRMHCQRWCMFYAQKANISLSGLSQPSSALPKAIRTFKQLTLAV